MCHALAAYTRHNGGVASRSARTTKPTRPAAISRRLATAATGRISKYPGFRSASRFGLATVGIAFVLALVVIPARDYFTQTSALAQKTAEFETLADANEQLQTDVNTLKTTEGIRRTLRSQGYVLPGEQRITLAPMPQLPTDLPAQWPFTLVSDIISVRATAQGSAPQALAPLAP